MPLEHIIGQEPIKQQIEISVAAAQMKNTVLPHTLLCGPSGYGKTKIASVIAELSEAELIEVNGAGVDSIKKVAEGIVQHSGAVLFIDEIHNLKPDHQDFLLTAMTEFKLTMGDSSVSVRPFTLIGATTDEGCANFF